MREWGEAASACLWKWGFAYEHLDTHGAKLKRFQLAWSSLDLNLQVTPTVTPHQVPEISLTEKPLFTWTTRSLQKNRRTLQKDYTLMNSRTIFKPFWTWQLGRFQLGAHSERDALLASSVNSSHENVGWSKAKSREPQSPTWSQIVSDTCSFTRSCQRSLQAGPRHVKPGM